MSGSRMAFEKMAFEKWEGLGNDFVVVEAEASGFSDDEVRAICDRRFGVGADGVLFVDVGRAPALPPAGGATPHPQEAGAPEAPKAVPRMVVRNADGSRPEMCGNGIRCVAGWLAARGRVEGGVVVIATDAGDRRCEVRAGAIAGRRAAGDGFEVSVEMGAARIEGELVAEIGGVRHAFVKGDVGNPHAITFEAYSEAEIDRVGPFVATLPAAGTNVEFCRVVEEGDGGKRIDVIVWERGVGRTLACGTGACAVAAAACAAGRATFGESVRVRLPGGELSIVVREGTWAATMRGPARRVFSGELA